MRVAIPYESNQTIGGGYTFYRNLVKGLREIESQVEIIPPTEPYDLLFGFSPTTISGEEIQRAKDNKKPFVLRMDGVPEDSRNSGRGTRRLVEYSQKADLIIYQSTFVAETVGRILMQNGVKAPGVIIKNGVDTKIYNPDGPKVNLRGKPVILHMAYRKDPNKRYEEVLAMYREYWTWDKEALLLLIGRYPSEYQDYNMGFFNGERFQRMGVMEDENAKATFIRSADVFFYPSYADPAPNAILEVMACGIPVIYNPYGGVVEYVGKDAGLSIGYKNLSYIELIDQASKIDRAKVYAEIANNYTLEKMAKTYEAVFIGGQQ